MTLSGKGCFIDKITQCEQGNTVAIASKARSFGLSHVIINVAECAQPANIAWAGEVDLVFPLVAKLKEKGIQTWGWQTLHGDDPIGEAQMGIKRVQDLGLDGFVIQARDAYEHTEKAGAARSYLQTFRTDLPDLPLALSSFAFPSYHPRLPWREFLQHCNYTMPQIEWNGIDSPRQTLMRCLREYQTITPNRPVVPTGCIGEHTSSNDLLVFMQTSQTMNLKAVNFWHWDASVPDRLMGLWADLADSSWFSSIARDALIEEYFAALNSVNPSRVLDLYASRAALVTPKRTYVGKQNILAWHQELLSQRLTNTYFQMTSFSGLGSSRNMRWIAKSRPNVFSSPAASPIKGIPGSVAIYQGIKYKKLSRSSPRQHTIYAVSVDLDDAYIGLQVTPPAGLGRTTSSCLGKYFQQVTINGDEWLSWRNPKGLAVAEGVKYSEASPEPTIYISQDNQVQIGGDPPAIIWNAISGSHTLVRGGAINAKLRGCSKPEYCTYLAPRTSVGLTDDNKLILIVVQGPSGKLRNALTLRELAALNLEFGVVEAINMDGGGSSAMAINNYGIPQVLNNPSDGSERAVSNHLGVFANYLDKPTEMKVSDGNDTLGLLDGKIIYHFTDFTIAGD